MELCWSFGFNKARLLETLDDASGKSTAQKNNTVFPYRCMPKNTVRNFARNVFQNLTVPYHTQSYEVKDRLVVATRMPVTGIDLVSSCKTYKKRRLALSCGRSQLGPL